MKNGKPVKSGECANADVALLGAILMRMGIFGKKKEEVKKYVYDTIIAHRKNAIKTKKPY